MIISKKELLDLYSNCYDDQAQAAELNKNVTTILKGFAEHQDLNPKAVKAGYIAYKSYMKGNVNPTDDDYMEILTIVEDSFGG